MIQILSQHNYPENRVITGVYPTAPKDDFGTEVEEVVAEAPTYDINPVNFPEEELTAPEHASYDQEESPVYTEAVEVDEVEKKEIEFDIPDANLFRISASPQVKSGFAVQVGVFADYGNILTESAKFKVLYNQEAVVQVSHLNGKQVFKLMIGDFSNIEEAHSLRRLMESHGLEGITKDLSKI